MKIEPDAPTVGSDRAAEDSASDVFLSARQAEGVEGQADGHAPGEVHSRSSDESADDENGTGTSEPKGPGSQWEGMRNRPRGPGKMRGRRGRGPRTTREMHAGSVAPALPPKGTHKVLLLNASDPGEIRVALLEDGELAEVFVERQSHRQQTGNIYKARIVNIEPSLQAAFVDLGSDRNGFLHVSDCIQPDGGYGEILHPDPTRVESKQPVLETVPAVTDGVVVENEGFAEKTRAGNPSRSFRRRRGGRGRSGRNRKPSTSAPMLLPESHGNRQPAEDEEGGIQQRDGALQEHDEIQADAFQSAMLEPLPVDDAGNQQNDASRGEVSSAVFDELPSNVIEEHAGANGGVEDSQTLSGEMREAEQDAEIEKPRQESAAPRAHVAKRGRDAGRRMAIQNVLTKGQEVLVQVAKEGMGQKGPALTTYLSIPGRYLVLMPAVHRLGVSKRIESEEKRRELKDMLASLKVPDGMGVIVRTVGVDCTQEKLKQDFDYLLNCWDMIKKKARSAPAPAMVFQEGDVVTRVFRDVFTDDVAEVVIDDQMVLDRAREFLKEISPGAEQKLFRYKGQTPLFHRYGVEPQIARVFNRKVALKNGGSIVIEQTEALVAIDVNTGRFREKTDQDETILATNLEAARVIARELRLRDIGGLVMIDFIDMDIEEHRRKVERELRAHLARDKARINVLPISALGVVEMTRQRVRHSLRRTLFTRCPYCEGAGQLKSIETMGLEILRELRAVMSKGDFNRGRVSLHPTVALEILNAMRNKLTRLEEANGRPIEVHGDASLTLSQWRVSVAKESVEWVQKREGEVDSYVRNS